MDSGEVIPNLDEPWTMAGATVMEWSSGFVMAIMVMEIFFGTTAKYTPVLIAVLLGTTFGLAMLRRSFPDSQKGLANSLIVQLGSTPPGLPAPAQFQPEWSAAPLKLYPEEKEYTELSLHLLFPVVGDPEEEDEIF